eukprot:c42955_g1_i1 orf=219-551(+)
MLSRVLGRNVKRMAKSTRKRKITFLNDLPAELLEKILSALPSISLIKVQLVYKAWKTLARSPTLWVFPGSLHRPEEWLVLNGLQQDSKPKRLHAYVCANERWLHLPIAFL